VIPEACANIAYSIVSGKRDAFRDASSISKTRVTSVTVMGDPYLKIETRLRVERFESVKGEYVIEKL